MADLTKATRATIQIGGIEIDGFMLPNGDYRMSQSQIAECVGKPKNNALRFLDSNAFKALLGKGYTGYTPDSIEIEPEPGKRGQSRFNAIPLDIGFAYWVNQTLQGNKRAATLVVTLGTETLERLFDKAFGVSRSEDEYKLKRDRRIKQLETNLEKLGEAYAIDDDKDRRIDYLERLLQDHNIDPDGLPKND